MATLYITYFATVDKGCASDPIKTESVTTSGASAQGAAIPPEAVIAHFYSDAAHILLGGANPTAAAGAGSFVQATELWYRLPLTRASGYKFAAITA